MRPTLAGAALLLVAACAPVPVPRRSVYHPSDADLSVTRIVHGSVIIEMHRTRVLVDPWFHSGWVTRQDEPLGLVPEGLPTFAAVLLTHEHSDRFDPRALRKLASTVPEVVAPPELHERLSALGFARVTDLGWWDTTSIGDVSVTAVPAHHSTPENGYVLEAHDTSVYVAGDPRYFPELIDVATRFPHLDAALLTVGGERLLGFRREMGPDEAAHAAEVIGASHLIPIAYAERWLFPLRWYALRPVARFVDECRQRGIDRSRIVILEPGESWHYYRSADTGTAPTTSP
ncbi:MAG TPA: MBL fold metallo-hydrolase [Candidatus Binatus sp.]|nr:MBL fold metallo-hydrolase [Candidatus Binatus sp.]